MPPTATWLSLVDGTDPPGELVQGRGALVTATAAGALALFVVTGCAIPIQPDPVAAAKCMSQPEVAPYIESVREKVIAKWQVDDGAPTGTHRVTLRLFLAEDGSLHDVELLTGGSRKVALSCVGAVRAAAPFPPMPESVRCLAEFPFLGTFTLMDDRE